MPSAGKRLPATVATYWGWGLMWWSPTFLMGVHGMANEQARALFGTINDIGGALAITISALVIHRLARYDPRCRVLVAGIAPPDRSAFLRSALPA